MKILETMQEYGIPAHNHGGIHRYVMHGVPLGSFLQAVFENDLMGAFSRADGENRKAMGDIAAFLWNEVPMGCHGSPEKVKAWCEAGGLLGK